MKGKNARFLQKTVLIAVDVLIILLATLLAYASVTGGNVNLAIVGFWALCNVTLTVIFFSIFGLYDVVFSSIGLPDIVKNVLAALILAILNLIGALATGQQHIRFGMVLI